LVGFRSLREFLEAIYLKGKLFIGLIVTIMVIIIVLIFHQHKPFNSIKNPSKNTISFEYYVKIVPLDRGNFTICIPLPVDINDEISHMINDRIIIKKGIATIRIINTEYGWALEINSNQTIVIESIGEKILYTKRYPTHMWLSMVNETKKFGKNTSYWVYCKTTVNLSVTVNFYYEHVESKWVHSKCFSRIDAEIGCGDHWELIDGSRETVEA
jgi:hypothetical protein